MNEYLTRYLYVQVAFHFCLFNFKNCNFFICVQKKSWHWSCNFCWSSDIIFFLSVQVYFEKDKVFETGICSVIYYGAHLDIYLFKNSKSSSTFSEQQQGWTILAEGEGLGKVMLLTLRNLHGWCIFTFLKSKQISKMKP